MKYGIIAGTGLLPQMVIDACVTQNQPYYVLAFQGQTHVQLVKDHPHDWVYLGAVGKAVRHLKAASVTHVVLAGHFQRPAWSQVRPDFLGAQWLARLSRKALGDDGVLRLITEMLEESGFEVVGAQDIIGKNLLATEGALGHISPSNKELEDIHYGSSLLDTIGKMDIGQSLVIQEGLVLGLEAIEGTDRLIERCALLKRGESPPVLVKKTKPNQEDRVDLPTVGIKTLKNLYTHGFRGLAIEANKTILLNQQEVIDFINTHKMFIYGL